MKWAVVEEGDRPEGGELRLNHKHGITEAWLEGKPVACWPSKKLGTDVEYFVDWHQVSRVRGE